MVGLQSKTPARKQKFLLVLIKPSHYDDDGYVIRWWRALIPSNSLAVMYGLALDSAQKQVLGPDIEIEIIAIDETNTRVNTKKLVRKFRRCGLNGLVCLTGVQSNQYPRALDIARPFRQAEIKVAIGGFHVSGCLAMLDGKAVDLDRATGLGVTIFAGEAEQQLNRLLADAATDQLQPIYDHVKQLPDLGAAPMPFLPRELVEKTAGTNTSFDAGRGCPFQCSFCTIINVQGRQSRYRSPDDIEAIVRANWAQGISRFFITDDNFARNRAWEGILDRLVELREVHRIPLGLMIQVDTLCHKIPNFIEKCKRAGVTRVFIGLENINPESLQAAKKRQNKISEYRRMLLAWRNQGIFTYAGYILGFPSDTPETIRRDIAIIQRELPVDILEFFILTPLPGSEDHQRLWKDGTPMDDDLNKYDLEHVVVDHPGMTRAELQAVYHDAWSLYYSDAHVETLLRRAAANDIPLSRLLKVLVPFKTMVTLEGIHPLQSGLFRLKHPSERRPGLARENSFWFWVTYTWETTRKSTSLVRVIASLMILRRRVERDSRRQAYVDAALSPKNADHEPLLRSAFSRDRPS
jgi:radical SAM superfamily enzyme YgiQ (UPF0313 family)